MEEKRCLSEMTISEMNSLIDYLLENIDSIEKMDVKFQDDEIVIFTC